MPPAFDRWAGTAPPRPLDATPAGRARPLRLTHAGLERTARVYEPPTYVGDGTTPLVIVLHASGGTGKGAATYSNFDFEKLADRDGFVVAYPDGIENNWNDGRDTTAHRAHREQIDDVGFLERLIDDLSARYRIDPRRVFVTGTSNGAMMSYRLAAELSKKVAAIAPVIGNMPMPLIDEAPTDPVSVLAINGTDDPVVPYDGGDIGSSRGEVASVRESLRFWIEHNGTNGRQRVRQLPDDYRQDDTTVAVREFPGGRDDTSVVAYTIRGGGHNPPSGLPFGPVSMMGRGNADFNAAQVIWDFFRRHPKP
jgi:polyhydroxybutyrate depolymerase